MTAALVVLFAGLTAGTLGYDLLRRYASDAVSNRWVALALTILTSGLALFAFLLSAYYRLPNARLTRQEVLPRSILGAIVLVGTLQALPLFVTLTSEVVALQALGTTFLLLVAVRDGERDRLRAALNYVLAYGDGGREVLPKRADDESARRSSASACAARARWECVRFQSSPRTATVSVSPSGTKTGSNPKPSLPDAARAIVPSSVPGQRPRGRRGRSRRGRRRSAPPARPPPRALPACARPGRPPPSGQYGRPAPLRARPPRYPSPRPPPTRRAAHACGPTAP